MRTACAALLVVGLLATGTGCKRHAAPTQPAAQEAAPTGGASPPAPGATPKRGTFAVGKSTTYALGPLDATGHLDYVAALHERASQDITADENANVLLWKVIGPTTPDGTKVPPAHFYLLRMAPPPSTGEYFIGLGAYSSQPGHGQVDAAALTTFSARPWTANEHPALSGWLRANAKPLTLLRDAVRAPRYYNPVVPTEAGKGLSGAVLPGATAGRELAGALACRAMLSLGHGDLDGAWQDIITCHRLGRLVGHGSTLIEGVVAMAIEYVACRAEVAFLARAQAPEACLRDLVALPPPPNVAAQIDLGERFWFLDTIMQIDKRGWADVPLYGPDFQPIRHGLSDDILSGFDWNPALELANAEYDRFVTALRVKDRAERRRRLAASDAELRPFREQFQSGRAEAAIKTETRGTARGLLLGRMLLANLPESFLRIVDAEDRAKQTFDTVLVAFALACHQQTTGRYPDSLARLAPDYLQTVPGDVFSGKELIYRPHPAGFVLYSVGPNGTDDGARSRDSRPPGDDIVVQVPLPAAP